MFAPSFVVGDSRSIVFLAGSFYFYYIFISSANGYGSTKVFGTQTCLDACSLDVGSIGTKSTSIDFGSVGKPLPASNNG